ncbi:chemotaxis protein CheW [uncultured Alsobacter sp.]|uniref:hybrid sensor histidine kinase/response regulator n=1 Tax=uncultured Alsobacter sp. TaxID=1748258 RepID=UPI0025CDA465|nr:chemotaxis protein CheW [uncultured Alsobacter sp.]
MDEILRDFVTETADSIESVDRELVRLEQDPNDETILANIFRLVHTIKGTCGFLGLNRLESLSHAAETVMSQFREGKAVTTDAVDLILATVDRIKLILRSIEENAVEPDGDDGDLIRSLERTAGDVLPGSDDEIVDVSEPIALPEPELPAVAASKAANAENAPDAGLPKRRSSNAAQSQSIRVPIDTIESLMTMVSELVLTRNQLVEISRRAEYPEFKTALQRLSSVTAELQERVMKTRMQPISTAWQKLPRLVRDLCAELGKDIELELAGADTELDRQVLELVKDPFTHLIRNAADHGIEMPHERRRLGKSPRGTIRISAQHESGTISIDIADDGRGIDIGRVAAKAIERGLVTPAELERMTEERIARFIFEPGFSTMASVSHVSGRGVGMDVVRSNIELIGGSVDVRWTKGQGAVFTIKIPLTLAIVAALIIETAGQRFALPQSAVVELVQPLASAEHRLEKVRGSWLLRLRETQIPVVRLASILGIEDPQSAPTPQEGFVVVIKLGKRVFGLAVDAVFHTEEIVVKPLSGLLRSLSVFSGNTILGDGAVVLILDPNGILARLGDQTGQGRGERDETPRPRKRLHEEKSSFLVFRAGFGEAKAVSLAAVTRLEEVDMASIETVAGRKFIQYRGELIPIMQADEGMDLGSGIRPVLLFSDGQRTAGLVVDEIVDIVEDHFDVKPVGQMPGLLGTAVIRERATEVLDIGYWLASAHPDHPEGQAAGPAPRSRRIMLLEAAPFFRGMLAPVLKAAGYEVVALAEVDAAIGLLERGEPFDAIVADVEAPGRNGFDLAEELRAGHRLRQPPVIALSARGGSSVVDRARRLELADVVSKFDRPGLLDALAETLADAEALS